MHPSKSRVSIPDFPKSLQAKNRVSIPGFNHPSKNSISSNCDSLLNDLQAIGYGSDRESNTSFRMSLMKTKVKRRESSMFRVNTLLNSHKTLNKIPETGSLRHGNVIDKQSVDMAQNAQRALREAAQAVDEEWERIGEEAETLEQEASRLEEQEAKILEKQRELERREEILQSEEDVLKAESLDFHKQILEQTVNIQKHVLLMEDLEKEILTKEETILALQKEFNGQKCVLCSIS